MNRWRRQFAVLSILLLLAGACTLWLCEQQRHYTLNRQLIAALVKGDDQQALALVNEGADPNTQFAPRPIPSLLELAKQLLYRSPPPPNKSPTALLLACGASWFDSGAAFHPVNRRDNLQLVQAMLRRGANINASGTDGETPLEAAAYVPLIDTVNLLLTDRADVDARDDLGRTPLMLCDNVHVAATLLRRGANINAQDRWQGWTPLMWAINHGNDDKVQLLLARHADPNIKARNGARALSLIKENYMPEVDWEANILRLLKTAGAKE